MSRPLFKAAIVGCGTIAGLRDIPRTEGRVETHAQAFWRHPDFELSAIAEADSDRREYFRRVWNIPNVYCTLEELLSGGSLDVISLCTPNRLHAAQIRQVLQAPKPPGVLFTEKPVCLQRAELQQLLQLTSADGCQTIVNHTRRFDPAHLRLHQAVTAGELGIFLGGRCDYYGGWLNNGCHVVDTLCMIVGGSPVVASAAVGAHGREDDACLDVRLLFGGSPVDIKSFDDSFYQIFEMDLRFEKARVLLSDFGSLIRIERVAINTHGEKVLTAVSEDVWEGLDSPLYHSVAVINDFFKHATPLAGRGILLGEVRETMEILWQARDKAAQKP